jgi:hypothetical protein
MGPSLYAWRRCRCRCRRGRRHHLRCWGDSFRLPARTRCAASHEHDPRHPPPGFHASDCGGTGPARSALVRPNTAINSGPSFVTRSNFQPRFPISARHPISFSHSSLVARKTRRSATASHCGGYGLGGGEEGGGRAISRVLFTRPRADRWSSLWGGCHQPPRRGLPAAQTTRVESRCLFGLAPTGGYRATPVARRAVGSYPTVSPLPPTRGRFVFCGPIRRLAAPRRYLAVYPVELGLSSAHPTCRCTATIAPSRHQEETYRPRHA